MSPRNVDSYDLAVAALLNRPDVQILTADQEQALLRELDECKRLLLNLTPPDCEPALDDQPEREIQDFVRELLHQPADQDPVGKRMTQLAARYIEIRAKLAMANLRLVAHVARKYRNRGVAPSDLLQEGFCGLLKALDRFELDKKTRLASYAVWWIRQALQRAVAASAYPVRLNPRHLRQLAQRGTNPPPAGKTVRRGRTGGVAATIEQIHTATRPTVSLNSDQSSEEGSCLLNILAYPARDEDPPTELDEYLLVMLRQLKPREQVVLQLRFGLGGQECHSLSQVSEVLDVSKERIRQIQEAALEKLRKLAQGKACCEAIG